MKLSALSTLCCPFCNGDLRVVGSEQIKGDVEYGILSCYCGRYPVVAGIPILKKGRIGANPHTTDEISDLIEAGRHREALFAAVMPREPESAELAPSWIQTLPSVRGVGRVKGLLGQGHIRAWREEGEALFGGSEKGRTAEALLEFYFRHTADGSRNWGFYAFRLGAPRQLVAVSLASIIDQPKGPILDLACGMGTALTRNLVANANGQLVFGADIDFFSLWMANTLLAPGAQYVCSAADVSVPFKDRSFFLAFISDAFSLFLNQASCFRELKRVIREDGIMIISSLRNGLVKKDLYSGSILPALPPEGYRTLAAGIPHRLVGNPAIMDRYVKKQGPPLARQPDSAELANAQWLSIVASFRSEVFRDYPEFQDWPHAVGGQLKFNPLYKEERKDRDNVVLRRVYPSAWYEQENASDYPEYLPAAADVSSKGMEALAQMKRTPEIERLIEQGIVIAIPDAARATESSLLPVGTR